MTEEHEHGLDGQAMATDKWLTEEEQVFRCECGKLFVLLDSRELTEEELAALYPPGKSDA